MTGASFPMTGASSPMTGASFPMTGASFPMTGASFLPEGARSLLLSAPRHRLSRPIASACPLDPAHFLGEPPSGTREDGDGNRQKRDGCP